TSVLQTQTRSGPVLVALPGTGPGARRLAAGHRGRGVICPVPVPVTIAVTVAVRRLQLHALGDDVVEPGPDLAQRAAHLRGRHAVLVLFAGRRQPWRLRPENQRRPLLLRDRAGLLDVLAVGQLPDDPGLHPVLEQVCVLALEAQADPLGQDV